jgi:hypothetical protein
MDYPISGSTVSNKSIGLCRTDSDGSLQAKEPNFAWNQLKADSGADPLIDGNQDPWLAPWDGTVGRHL